MIDVELLPGVIRLNPISRRCLPPRVMIPLTAAVAAFLGGCQRGDVGPQLYPVTGIVSLDGSPVAGATVTFAPLSEAGRGAQATTDAAGTFDVHVMLDMGKSTKRGLPAGEYGISVIKMEMSTGGASLSTPPRNTLPAKYADPMKSGLKESVAAGVGNHFEFRLNP